MESITGAVLIDSKLSLDEVWKVFKPILSPLVTPDKLELPPSRELTEMCDSLGYSIKEHYVTIGDIEHAVLKLQLETALLYGRGTGSNSKAAKGMAALELLKKLEVSLFLTLPSVKVLNVSCLMISLPRFLITVQRNKTF